MKNLTKNIFKIFAVLFVVYGCELNDEFLERQPLDKISDASFWNTENDLMVYNHSFYDMTKDDNTYPFLMGHDDGFDSHRISYLHLDGMSDNTAPRHGRHSTYQQIRSGVYNTPSGKNSNAPGGWYGYKGFELIRAVNIGLANYGKADISDAVKSHYEAEARLFRAMFYANKIKNFGTVQWVENEVTLEDQDILYGARDSRDFVMGKVLDDLNFAAANMRDNGHQNKLSKSAALLMKSRICLSEGTWRKYHGLGGEATYLQAAADAAKELIDSGKHSLHVGAAGRTYNELHSQESLDGNSEVIFFQRYERGTRTNHVQSYNRGYNGGATKSMVEDYLCSDGLPISLSPLYQGDATLADVFTDRDPRLRQSILHPADQPIYSYGNHAFDANPYPRIQGMSGGLKTYTGYHIIKVYNVVSAHASYNSSITPGISMRYAEALLNYAEAKAELGGGAISQADLDISINKLRDRDGMVHLVENPPMDPRYAADGISAVLVE
ncbi:MAG: RagB/SusD family nutrient uptake outer membrane protein, partial [Flavobacteriaceae bacterium]|nr:RagB/SusD family nutrient uptake outer membrane protein [Flavobacteriaceae bacterium]